jgi:hypothetical protein
VHQYITTALRHLTTLPITFSTFFNFLAIFLSHFLTSLHSKISPIGQCPGRENIRVTINSIQKYWKRDKQKHLKLEFAELYFFQDFIEIEIFSVVFLAGHCYCFLLFLRRNSHVIQFSKRWSEKQKYRLNN